MKNCLIKISGDFTTPSLALVEFIRRLSCEFFVVICIGGGGKQINEAFLIEGIDITFGPLGRETKGLHEKQLARDILERNQAEFQDALQSLGVHATVVIPVIESGTVLCHVNGDQYVLATYLGFESIFVVTAPERVEAKSIEFAKYPKIKVVSL